MSTTPTDGTAPPIDRDALKEKIAALDDAGRFHESAALKTILSRPDAPQIEPQHAREIVTLRDAIAQHEAAGRFAAAAPLKSRLTLLVTSSN